MGIRDAFWPWIPQRATPDEHAEDRARLRELLSAYDHLTHDELHAAQVEHLDWLRDQLRELGATDDVFGVLDRLVDLSAFVGVFSQRALDS